MNNKKVWIWWVIAAICGFIFVGLSVITFYEIKMLNDRLKPKLRIVPNPDLAELVGCESQYFKAILTESPIKPIGGTSTATMYKFEWSWEVDAGLKLTPINDYAKIQAINKDAGATLKVKELTTGLEATACIITEEISEIKITVPSALDITKGNFALPGHQYQFEAETYGKNGIKVPMLRKEPTKITWKLSTDTGPGMKFPGQINSNGLLIMDNAFKKSQTCYVWACICEETPETNDDKCGASEQISAKPNP